VCGGVVQRGEVGRERQAARGGARGRQRLSGSRMPSSVRSGARLAMCRALRHARPRPPEMRVCAVRQRGSKKSVKEDAVSARQRRGRCRRAGGGCAWQVSPAAAEGKQAGMGRWQGARRVRGRGSAQQVARGVAAWFRFRRAAARSSAGTQAQLNLSWGIWCHVPRLNCPVL